MSWSNYSYYYCHPSPVLSFSGHSGPRSDGRQSLDRQLMPLFAPDGVAIQLFGERMLHMIRSAAGYEEAGEEEQRPLTTLTTTPPTHPERQQHSPPWSLQLQLWQALDNCIAT